MLLGCCKSVDLLILGRLRKKEKKTTLFCKRFRNVRISLCWKRIGNANAVIEIL